MGDATQDVPAMDKKQQGLIEKYRVERVDGKPVRGGIFLEFDDPNSWDALRTWAYTVERAGYLRLAADVRREVYEQAARAARHHQEGGADG